MSAVSWGVIRSQQIKLIRKRQEIDQQLEALRVVMEMFDPDRVQPPLPTITPKRGQAGAGE